MASSNSGEKISKEILEHSVTQDNDKDFCACVYLVTRSCWFFVTPWIQGDPGVTLLGSTIYGIFQVRILEWVSIFFSGGSSQPRYRTQVSCIAGRFFTICITSK